MTTYKFRIKDSSHKHHLNAMANSVNHVWNFCNATSIESARRNKLWIGEFDLNRLLCGVSKDLGLNSKSIYETSRYFVKARSKARRPKLQWRSYKRSLGWIPFKENGVQLTEDGFKYLGREYKCWMSRPLEGKVKNGSINQDSKGHWYINLTCEISVSQTDSKSSIGVDLGLKTLATCSDGYTIENPREFATLQNKLAIAQRAGHKRQTVNIHKKIANRRKDFLHKESTKLIKQHKNIYVGDVSSAKLKKTRMAKSVSDAGWSSFKLMLEYKAKKLGVNYRIVNEMYSTVTCSACSLRTGPSGLSALGIRHWECECGASHDRDINAAQNILKVGVGYDTPLGETA